MRSNLSALLGVLLSLSAAPLLMMAVVVVLCGFAAWSPAAIVHYGNDVEFPDSSDHSPDYLLGSKYTVTQKIVLQKAGITFKDFFNFNAKVGIYTDAGGAPNTLVAETGEFHVMSPGVTETPLLTTHTIPAGDYWFMAVFDAFMSVGISYGGKAQADYIGHKFNSPLPATFPAPRIYTREAFNYYLVGETTRSGDYNQDGVVDAADYVVWRKDGGTQAGYEAWRAHFGTSLGSGSGPALPSADPLSAAVPEPATLILMFLAAVGWNFRRGRVA
jgi:PEP-CTERM motif